MARTMYRTTLGDERDSYALYDFPHHSRFMRDVITVGDCLGTNRIYGEVTRIYCNQQGVAVAALIKRNGITSFIDLDDVTDFDSQTYGQPYWEEYHTGDELREIWGDAFFDDDDDDEEPLSCDASDDDDDDFVFDEYPDDYDDEDEEDEDKDIIIEEDEEER